MSSATTPEPTDERIHRLVAGILEVAAHLADSPACVNAAHPWPFAADQPTNGDWTKDLAARRLRALAQPGLDPAMNDGWTLRTLTLGMRDLERHLIALGVETGSIGDGPYPPWEVAMGEIDRLRRLLAERA